MGSAPRTTRLTPSKLRWFRGLGLAILVSVLALQRLHTWSEPPETDFATYWVAANELLHGKVLYAEVWDIKPPAVYWTYAIAAAVTHDPFAARYVLWVVASVATLFGLYVLAARLTHSTTSGLVAGCFWVVIAGDCWLEANQPNTEVFINAATVWALAVLVGSKASQCRLRNAFLGGFLLGLAALFKTVVLAMVPLFALVLFACDWNTTQLKAAGGHACSRVRWPAVFVCGAALVWLLTCAYFLAIGAFSDFWNTIHGWGWAYSKDLIGNLIVGLTPERLLPQAAYHVLPVILTGFLGAVALIPKWRHVPAWWIFAWLVGAYIAYAAPGRFYRHYYQLALPIFCTLSAVAYASARRLSNLESKRRRLALLAVAFSLQVLLETPFYARPALEWSLAKYGDAFIREQAIGHTIGRWLLPHEFLYVWGTAPTVYEAAGRRPGSGIFFSIPLLWGPTTSTLTTRAIHDLERTRPELLIMDVWNVPAPATHPLVEWFADHYVAHPALPNVSAQFQAFVLRGGALEQRLDSKRGEYSTVGTKTR